MSFKVLLEKPVSSDGLNAGIHNAIANRLATLIRDEMSEGCTIGLEAGWGRGKSSVVTMMADELSKDEIFTYVFDSWEHEGETLRRGFLRGFIKRICAGVKQEPQEKVEELKKKSEELKCSTKVLSDKKSVSLTIAAVLAPLCVGLSTIGAVMIDKGLDVGSFCFDPSKPICWRLVVGVVLVLVPALVALVAWLCKCEMLNLSADSERSGGDEYRYERSSLDFQDEFESVVDIVRELGYKKIVIVLDNLDRVRREDALRLWSSLKTFLSAKSSPYVWVIIPYDPDGLSALWNRKCEAVEETHGEDYLNCRSLTLAQSFFDKSLPLRIELPYVRVDTLSLYLDDLLKKAFPTDDLGKREIIKRILIFTRQGLDDIPSPRQIKSYINQVGILRSLYEDTVGLEVVCYYAILRYYRGMSKSELHKAIAQNQISCEDIRMVSWIPDFINRIAAIHYGLDLESAKSAILIGPLADAIKQDGIECLQDLMTRYGDDFWVQINLILAKELKSGWTPLVSNAFYKLHTISKTTGVKSSLPAVLLAHKDAVCIAIPNLSDNIVICLLEVAQSDVQLKNQIASSFIKAFKNRLLTTDCATSPTLRTYLSVASSGVLDNSDFIFGNDTGHNAFIRLCALSLQENMPISRTLISINETHAKECLASSCITLSDKNFKGCLPYLFDLLIGPETSWYKDLEKYIIPCLDRGGVLMVDYVRVALRCGMAVKSYSFKGIVESANFWQYVCAFVDDESRMVSYLLVLHQIRNRNRIMDILRNVQQRYNFNVMSIMRLYDRIEQKDPKAVVSLLLDEAKRLNSFEFVSWVVVNNLRALTTSLAQAVVDQNLVDKVILESPVDVTIALCDKTSKESHIKVLETLLKEEGLLKAFVSDSNFVTTGPLLPIIVEMLSMGRCPILEDKVKASLGSLSDEQWKKALCNKADEFYLLKALFNSQGSLEVLGNPYIVGASALLSTKRAKTSYYDEAEQAMIRSVLPSVYRKMLDESIVEAVFKSDFVVSEDMKRFVIDAFNSTYKDGDKERVLCVALKRARARNDRAAEGLIAKIEPSVLAAEEH